MVLARRALLASVFAASTTTTTLAFVSFQQISNARIAIERDEGKGRRRRRVRPRPTLDDGHDDDGVDLSLPPSALASSSSSSSTTTSSAKILSTVIDLSSLTVMDVVLFRRRRPEGDDDAVDAPTTTATATTTTATATTTTAALEIGAVQENGNVAPLSAWTLESAYTSRTNDMMAFVVDEHHQFPGLTSDDIVVLDAPSSSDGGSAVGYGSRQVGGGKGPGNPHGEESELLYYVDRGVVEAEYRVVTTTTMKEEGGVDGGVDDDDLVEVLTIDIVVNPGLEHLW
jgi:hypothetical protein